MFRKLILLIICFASACGPANAQPGRYAFTLHGTIAADTGSVELMPVGDSSYYPQGVSFAETSIRSGRFTISGHISYPCGFKLRCRSADYISDIFFLVPGEQTIHCNKDSLREVPAMENSSMRELQNDFLPGYLPLGEKFSNYDIRIVERRKYLLGYITRHPDSYVALWELVNQLKWSYSPLLDSGFEQLSAPLKNSYAGTALKRELKTARKIDVGRPFPELEVQDMQGRPKKIPGTKDLPEYTFIDFWFSHCGPCLGQFHAYKQICQTFKMNRFKFVGISIDSEKNISSWKKVIRDSALSWTQYLDVNGVLAAKLGLSLYPSNFLLDGSGKIIAKDLDPAQLESFLTAHLN